MKIRIPTFKDNHGDRSMERCLYHPRKKARQWTGHLILKGKTVFVGYCSDACSSSQGTPEGCAGNFKGVKP